MAPSDVNFRAVLASLQARQKQGVRQNVNFPEKSQRAFADRARPAPFGLQFYAVPRIHSLGPSQFEIARTRK
jgi:hypothetical protein